MNLFNLTGDYLRVLELSDQLDEQTFYDTLESIQEPIEVKMANYVKLIKAINADVEAIKKEEERLKKLKDSKNKTVSKLKETLLWSVNMVGEETATGGKKVVMKDDLYVKSVYTKRNPPSLEIVNDKIIPKKFKIPQPPKIDSRAILTAMKEDETLKVKGVAVKQGIGVMFN